MLRVAVSEKFAHNKPRFIEQQRKMALEHFKKSGNSNHSGAAMLLPFILNYCEENKISYILKAAPGQGYYIEKADWT